MDCEINEVCGFCDVAIKTLFETYQSKDWGMTWAEFLHQASVEFLFFNQQLIYKEAIK